MLHILAFGGPDVSQSANWNKYIQSIEAVNSLVCGSTCLYIGDRNDMAIVTCTVSVEIFRFIVIYTQMTVLQSKLTEEIKIQRLSH